MSSFEPDPIFAELAFRPADPRAAAGGGFAASASVPARGLGGARRGGDPGARGACKPEAHAELERAAFEKGRASAAADAARCEQACEVLERTAARLDRSAIRLLHESREAIVGLAAEIARRWIGEELLLEPARLAGVLERALAECEEAPVARVHVSPVVLEALSQHAPDFLERVGGGSAVLLVGEPGLEAADFRIETPTQQIASGLESLASRLRTELAGAFEAPAPEGGT